MTTHDYLIKELIKTLSGIKDEIERSNRLKEKEIILNYSLQTGSGLDAEFLNDENI